MPLRLTTRAPEHLAVFYTLSLDSMLLENISQVSQYIYSNYMFKHHFITRYFLVQFIKTDVLSRDSPPIRQTKQTIVKIEQKQKHGAIPLHHTPCVRFLVRGYSDQVPSLWFLKNRLKTLCVMCLTVWILCINVFKT